MERVKPVQAWLDEILSGRIAMEDAPDAVQSWARFAIYEGAVEIINIEFSGDRKAALSKIPERVRPYVEAEVKRLWPLREEIRSL